MHGKVHLVQKSFGPSIHTKKLKGQCTWTHIIKLFGFEFKTFLIKVIFIGMITQYFLIDNSIDYGIEYVSGYARITYFNSRILLMEMVNWSQIWLYFIIIIVVIDFLGLCFHFLTSSHGFSSACKGHWWSTRLCFS